MICLSSKYRVNAASVVLGILNCLCAISRQQRSKKSWSQGTLLLKDHRSWYCSSSCCDTVVVYAWVPYRDGTSNITFGLPLGRPLLLSWIAWLFHTLLTESNSSWKRISLHDTIGCRVHYFPPTSRRICYVEWSTNVFKCNWMVSWIIKPCKTIIYHFMCR